VTTTLLAVPNVSEGRDRATLHALGAAFAHDGARLLDIHSDADHHRSVFTLAGEPGRLHAALRSGARTALERLDISAHQGEHPRTGVLDVAPVVYLTDEDRGAACAEALLAADAIGALGIPVFLYGDLAGGRTRAELRRGGPTRLAERIQDGLRPDYGPAHLHPTAGATLVAARPPLIAFNVELATGVTLEQAKRIAAAIREGGPEGLPSVRAIGLHLHSRDTIQVSTNIEDHTRTSAAQVVEAVRRHAPVQAAELVALAPRAALRDFPPDVPLSGSANVIEDALER
jgi:glutamate formiminotransferase / 5-formyltetrahydrofolate cyclo-ligase